VEESVQAYETPLYFDYSPSDRFYEQKTAAGKIISVEGVLDSVTRTTEPPRLVVLKVLVVAHVPSADPAASCGWYSEALMLCMVYINRLLLDIKLS
jgi:hypothetical protein